MWNIVGDLVGGVVKAVVQSDNEKEVALRDSTNRRNADIAKALIEGAVSAYGIYANMKQAGGQVAAGGAGAIEASPDTPMLASSQPVWNLDYQSIWSNKSAGEMGANLVDANTGNTVQLSYRMQSIGNKVYKVLGKIAGEGWEEVGTIDWKSMNIGDLDNAQDQFPFLADILRIVMNK